MTRVARPVGMTPFRRLVVGVSLCLALGGATLTTANIYNLINRRQPRTARTLAEIFQPGTGYRSVAASVVVTYIGFHFLIFTHNTAHVRRRRSRAK